MASLLIPKPVSQPLLTDVHRQNQRDKVQDKAAASVELLQAAPSTGVLIDRALQALSILLKGGADLLCSSGFPHWKFQRGFSPRGLLPRARRSATTLLFLCRWGGVYLSIVCALSSPLSPYLPLIPTSDF